MKKKRNSLFNIINIECTSLLSRSLKYISVGNRCVNVLNLNLMINRQSLCTKSILSKSTPHHECHLQLISKGIL